jgi:hypothetical protein
MKNHIQIVSILHIAMGALSLLVAIGIFLFAGLAGGIVAAQAQEGAHAAGGIIGLVGFVVAGFLAVLSLPSIIGGWALMTGRSWGRIVVLVVAALHIMNVPLGTALGIYTFWALMYEPQQPPAISGSTMQPGA